MFKACIEHNLRAKMSSKHLNDTIINDLFYNFYSYSDFTRLLNSYICHLDQSLYTYVSIYLSLVL